MLHWILQLPIVCSDCSGMFHMYYIIDHPQMSAELACLFCLAGEEIEAHSHPASWTLRSWILLPNTNSFYFPLVPPKNRNLECLSSSLLFKTLPSKTGIHFLFCLVIFCWFSRRVASLTSSPKPSLRSPTYAELPCLFSIIEGPISYFSLTALEGRACTFPWPLFPNMAYLRSWGKNKPTNKSSKT